jgi:putative oxidoreductase
MKRSLSTEIFTALLMALFTYTAVSKIHEHKKFLHTLNESPLIHNEAGIIAWLLPAAELLIVLLLFFAATHRAGLVLSLTALSVFTLYLGYIILFASHLPCSCGGVVSGLSWNEHVVFNLCFIVINLLALQKEKKIFIKNLYGVSRKSRKPV